MTELRDDVIPALKEECNRWYEGHERPCSLRKCLVRGGWVGPDGRQGSQVLLREHPSVDYRVATCPFYEAICALEQGLSQTHTGENADG